MYRITNQLASSVCIVYIHFTIRIIFLIRPARWARRIYY